MIGQIRRLNIFASNQREKCMTANNIKMHIYIRIRKRGFLTEGSHRMKFIQIIITCALYNV